MQYDSEMAVAHQPSSAGVINVDCNEMLSELCSELEDEKAEHSVTKAYYRQVDDAYNQEAEVTQARSPRTRRTPKMVRLESQDL